MNLGKFLSCTDSLYCGHIIIVPLHVFKDIEKLCACQVISLLRRPYFLFSVKIKYGTNWKNKEGRDKEKEEPAALLSRVTVDK